MPSDETKAYNKLFLKRNDPSEILISKDNKRIKDLLANHYLELHLLEESFN